jgi:hypothetical protein
LGRRLGYDKTYVSLVENGHRSIEDVSSRRRIARELRLPAHVLGVTDPDDPDHAEVVRLGRSVLRLAEISRRCGQAQEAAAELWPLVLRLGARLGQGRTDCELLELTARTRLDFGVCLGHILPEEHLYVAARWTGEGLAVARHIGDPTLHAYALRVHGNELRKAGFAFAGSQRLRRAVVLATEDAERAESLMLLVRATGACGAGDLFDRSVRHARSLLTRIDHTPLANLFTLREVTLRGLASTGRGEQAARLVAQDPPENPGVTPQWRVIEHVTTGRAHLLRGDRSTAAEHLSAAITGAATLRLPHQLQRVIRAAGTALPDQREHATASLAALSRSGAATDHL